MSSPAGQKRKFNTHFIGYSPKKYILIEFPDTSKLGAFSQYICQGTTITVRGLIEGRDGAAVAFLGTIKQTLQIPARIMVLDIPNNITLQSLRTSIRIETDIKAKIRVENNYWPAIMSNLSIEGGQLDIINCDKLVLSEAKVIEIIVETSVGEDNIKLSATVCNLKQQVGGLSLGVKFNNASKPQLVELLYVALQPE